jgi:hypothetical protein
MSAPGTKTYPDRSLAHGFFLGLPLVGLFWIAALKLVGVL